MGGKWSKFKLRRRAIVRDLIAIINKKTHEAIFDEDYKEIDKYKNMLQFMQSLDFGALYNEDIAESKRVCPICGSEDIVVGHIEPVCFDGINKEELGKIEGLNIYRCLNCGFYNIDGW